MIVCILAFSAMAQKYEKVNGIVDYAEAIVGKRYWEGLRDQTIFPEIDMDKVLRVRGMNVTFVMKAACPAAESLYLLKKLGMPFAS